MNTLALTQEEAAVLEAKGRLLAFLLDELMMPPHHKSIFEKMLPHLSPEQLDQLIVAMKDSLIEQVTINLDPEYQAAVAEIDADTAEQLRVLEAEIKAAK